MKKNIKNGLQKFCKLTLVLSTTIVASLFFLMPSFAIAEKQNVFSVIKVVDGDTLVVSIRGKTETVRLLGIDTPESVDPRKPVQCFGKEATTKLKSFVSGKSVILVDDDMQGNRDRYHRLLRYVYLPDSRRTFVNGEMVKQGYAFHYREYPTALSEKFNTFERFARDQETGLWGSCPTNKTKTIPLVSISPIKKETTTVLGDKDCGDFSTHIQAQEFFIAQGGPARDPHKLDGNHDGQACETLP